MRGSGSAESQHPGNAHQATDESSVQMFHSTGDIAAVQHLWQARVSAVHEQSWPCWMLQERFA
jgi:hypothetical protein